VVGDFASSDPDQKDTVPIIPLCGTAADEVPEPARAKIAAARLNQVLDWTENRLRAVSKPLIDSAVSAELERALLLGALNPLIKLAMPKLRNVLQDKLKNEIAP
jgi:hypothetical protein